MHHGAQKKKKVARMSETRPTPRVSREMSTGSRAQIYIYIYIYILRIHFLDVIERDRFDCKLTSSRNGLFGRRENTKIEVAFDIHDGQCKDDGFDLVAMVG